MVAGAAARDGRLRPGLPVLWRSLTQVQVGTDPRWSVVLTDLSPAAARALHGTSGGASVRALRSALSGEVQPAEADAVLAHLRATGLVVDDAPRSADDPDRAAWSVLSPDGDGAAVVAARGRRRVRVDGLDRVGMQLATLLAAAGVGTVEPTDAGVVTVHDTAPAGATTDDVGRPRPEVASRLLRRAAPAVRTTAVRTKAVRTTAVRATPDLVVRVEHGAADPVGYRSLMADGVPHLSVVVREASVLVGPLVEPGRSPCLGCLDLHRSAGDDRWPAVAAQLVAGPPGGIETVLAAVAAATAAAQVVAHLDGRPTSVAGACLEVRLPDLLPRRQTWPLHPQCGCSGLDVS